MSLMDEVGVKLRQPSVGGWKELVQGQPEVQNHIIELIGNAIKGGNTPSRPIVLVADAVLRKDQHINDIDLLLILLGDPRDNRKL